MAFSYAGEDREYVEGVARAIAGRARVFFDRHEQVDLWGKDLYEHLSEVYGRKSRFCVIFISEHYARKVWTNHERERAQARAMEDLGAYLLPARFDDTLIPGLSLSIGAVDLRTLSPESFSELLLEKIRGSEERVPAPPRGAMMPMVVLGAVTLVTVALVSGLFSFRATAAPGIADAGRRSEAAKVSTPRANGPAVTASQVLDVSGRGSTATVDGGLHVKVATPVSASQVIKVSNGATANVGDITYEQVSPAPGITP